MQLIYGTEILDEADVRISPWDRGYQFGDGVYEVVRMYRGRLYAMDMHLDRLRYSLGELRISVPDGVHQLEALAEKLARDRGIDEGILYVQVTRGAARRTHAFPPEAHPVLIGYVEAVPRPLEEFERGVTAILVPDVRWHRVDIKSLNLLGNVLAKQAAVERGAGEAIFVRGDVVTEGSSTNVFLVRDGVLFTHPTGHHILNGITRQIVIRLAKELGIPVQEEAFTPEALFAADELFLTSTIHEVTPIVQVDGRDIADGRPGPVTRRLQEAFAATLPI
ncbi:MAG: D-alanine aminotransferase [Brockia lithotrophica]|uniref:D-alanine aminotransferase n=1 Tax=Brockia lithotrophica TaxID=933949 RepID=A0A2T5G6A0_9BACL|nr:MAG: D-alanine aminotransferase [Brockia lithotrophica]